MSKKEKVSFKIAIERPEACGQTVLHTSHVSFLIGKMVKSTTIKNSNATFWVIFQQCVFVEIEFMDLSETFRKVWSCEENVQSLPRKGKKKVSKDFVVINLESNDKNLQ